MMKNNLVHYKNFDGKNIIYLNIWYLKELNFSGVFRNKNSLYNFKQVAKSKEANNCSQFIILYNFKQVAKSKEANNCSQFIMSVKVPMTCVVNYC